MFRRKLSFILVLLFGFTLSISCIIPKGSEEYVPLTDEDYATLIKDSEDTIVISTLKPYPNVRSFSDRALDIFNTLFEYGSISILEIAFSHSPLLETIQAKDIIEEPTQKILTLLLNDPADLEKDRVYKKYFKDQIITPITEKIIETFHVKAIERHSDILLLADILNLATEKNSLEVLDYLYKNDVKTAPGYTTHSYGDTATRFSRREVVLLLTTNDSSLFHPFCRKNSSSVWKS